MQTSSPESPKPPTPLKLLLMGDPGARKTWLALQFPDPHIYDCDRNLDGAKRILMEGLKDEKGKVLVEPLRPDLTFTFDNIRYNEEKSEMREIHECFDQLIVKLRLGRTSAEYQKRRTHIVDSLSHVNEFIIQSVLKSASKTSMAINLWTDFSSAAYKLIVARLDELNRPVICTVHQEKITEPSEANIMLKRTKEVNPLFSGRVGDSIGAFFTDVWQLEKREGSAGRTKLMLLSDRTTSCSHLKNSVGLPPELDITAGFKVIEPYLKGRL